MAEKEKYSDLIGTSVLVVDDNPDICELCREYLSPYGINVTINDGTDTITLLKAAEKCNVVFLDLMLEQTPGDAYCRAIDILFPAVGIVMITANKNSDIFTILKRQVHGNIGVLYKPFSAEDMLDEMLKVVKKY